MATHQRRSRKRKSKRSFTIFLMLINIWWSLPSSNIENLSKSAGIDLRHLQKTPYNRRSWCPFRGDWVWNSHTLHSCIEKKTIMFSSLNIICCNVLMYKPAGTKTVYQCRKHWKELQGWVSAVQVIPKDLWGSSNPHKPILCKQPTNQP